MEHNSRVASPAKWPGVRLRVSRQYVTKRGITVRKLLICALALGGFAVSAQAADLSDLASMKDPLPDTLSSHGVTLYGTVDVGWGYQSHAAPSSDAFYVGSDWTIYGSKFANGAQNGFTNNALEQSKVGLKIEEN